MEWLKGEIRGMKRDIGDMKREISCMKESIMGIGDYFKEEVGLVLSEVISVLHEPQNTWISNLIDIFAQEKSWTLDNHRIQQ